MTLGSSVCDEESTDYSNFRHTRLVVERFDLDVPASVPLLKSGAKNRETKVLVNQGTWTDTAMRSGAEWGNLEFITVQMATCLQS